MAGSSMDGLDLAHIVFECSNGQWSFDLRKCHTISYPEDLYEKLRTVSEERLDECHDLDREFGKWTASMINNFKSDLPKIDLLGVHGHTLVHKPEERISWQLGRGDIIAAKTGITTITNFRTEDVETGGQGAPLVPLGDFSLFDQFDGCINLGGIANISVKNNETAWDICPCNQVLNFFAEKLGKDYDEGGQLAEQGSFDDLFAEQILSYPYFAQNPPKSLPNNYIPHEILDNVDPINGLHTYTWLIAELISRSLPKFDGKKVLITGGGAFNKYLINCISDKSSNIIIEIPDSKLVSYKESLIFAFLALKRMRNEINVLSSVTGSSKDSSSGVIHLFE